MKKILVIDDEPFIAAVLKEFSSQLGYGAECTDSFERFRQLASSEEYWAFFSDMTLPGTSGLEIFHFLKTQQRSPLRFVLLSGGIPEDDVDTMIRDQLIHFIKKPFNFNDFKSAIACLETHT